MQIEFSDRGIYVRDIDLWLDPQEQCASAWLSHAHSDHARGLHCRIFATESTLKLYRLRWLEEESTPQSLTALDYGQSTDFNGAKLTCYPASHIVGAAQLLIEYAGERVVYTGDIKLREPICGAKTEIPECGRLIIESTFGLPIYHFISREEGIERIVCFARECLAERITPVFIGYPLGRGQETVYALCQAGVPTAVHGHIARMLPVYEAAGYEFPGWQPYKTTCDGCALVIVPGFKAFVEASGRNYRLAYVSGWAALDNARMRVSAEELIPYSDHADFEELLTMVERSGAREIDVVHGYAEHFAHILRQRGIEARAPSAAAARTDEEVPEG